ncbi:uncharacterized protein LOC131252457 [Magnolia sinica]|uniref:uncharacterized protein LOC131252457 n=1 Tax=Magnolia sinica TaxID=86752 RepID=UPI00265800D6|nr:uncharacterized protein LOC131252457 [Magnolia sinica]
MPSYSQQQQDSNPKRSTPSQQRQRQRQRQRQQTQKYPSFALWVSALLILFLALFFSFKFPNMTTTITTSYHRFLKPSFPSSKPARILRMLIQTFTKTKTTTIQLQEKKIEKPNSMPSPICLLWMAPFLSGGGYSSEAWSYITALSDLARKKESSYPRIRLRIEHHGDQESLDFWIGLPQKLRGLAQKLYAAECDLDETVVICHSEPGAWYPPLFETFPCPPPTYGEEMPLFVVGRTMFETDRVSPEHVKRCNRMDSVWVPTDFHVSSFVRSGVDPSKVVKMVQPVDVGFFNPSKHKALDLPSGGLILGSHVQNSEKKEFVFLSIFKWEYRKGWDVLLRSYLTEFCKHDGVVLYLLTNPYHSDKEFGSKILKFVEDSNVVEPLDGWAPVYVVDTHVPQIDLPKLYKAANAFVLPSRGEGWGRPLVEAMSMALPVIATNWSGPTEFLTEENAYPLPFDHMSEVTEGPFQGHLWAEPSVDKLRVLMRHVISNPEEARRKGIQAREDMIRRFSPEVVAGLVVDQILKISKKNV